VVKSGLVVGEAEMRGEVVAVHGSVIEMRFPAGSLPAINDAIDIEPEPGRTLVGEVQLHVSSTLVRAVSLENTAGLQRGAVVRATGSPLRAPVGDPVLGRLLNVLGEPADRGPNFPADIERRPIHAEAPSIDRLSGSLEFFHTGIKVIDLLAPLVKGGRQPCLAGLGSAKPC